VSFVALFSIPLLYIVCTSNCVLLFVFTQEILTDGNQNIIHRANATKNTIVGPVITPLCHVLCSIQYAMIPSYPKRVANAYATLLLLGLWSKPFEHIKRVFCKTLDAV
jgi:hypothetical protein